MNISLPFIHNITGLFTGLSGTNMFLTSLLFFFFVIVAYKALQIFLRAIVIGMISASFPVIASIFGLGIPLTFSSVIWFGLFGAVSYITYSMISGSLKIVKWSLMPFKRLFRSSPKEHHYHRTVIIREEELKKRKKKR